MQSFRDPVTSHEMHDDCFLEFCWQLSFLDNVMEYILLVKKVKKIQEEQQTGDLLHNIMDGKEGFSGDHNKALMMQLTKLQDMVTFSNQHMQVWWYGQYHWYWLNVTGQGNHSNVKECCSFVIVAGTLSTAAWKNVKIKWAKISWHMFNHFSQYSPLSLSTCLVVTERVGQTQEFMYLDSHGICAEELIQNYEKYQTLLHWQDSQERFDHCKWFLFRSHKLGCVWHCKHAPPVLHCTTWRDRNHWNQIGFLKVQVGPKPF